VDAWAAHSAPDVHALCIMNEKIIGQPDVAVVRAFIYLFTSAHCVYKNIYNTRVECVRASHHLLFQQAERAFFAILNYETHALLFDA